MAENPSPQAASEPSRRFDLIDGARQRVLVSIAASVGWVCFALLYAAFWAHYFTLFQNIVVIVVSLLVLGAVVVGAWLSFGMRFASSWSH